MNPRSMPPCTVPRRTVRGFTLIELMITVVLAAIVLAIGIPSFNSFIAGQRVKTAAADLASAVVLARSEAIKRNANVVITPTVPADGWVSGWRVTTAGVADPLFEQARFNNLTIEPGAADPATLTYTASGRPTAAATFEIGADNTGNRCVRIDLTGMPVSKTGDC